MKMIRVIKAKNINTNDKVRQLIDAALEGLLDDKELVVEFLKNMGISTRGLVNEYNDLDEQKCSIRIERAIRQNPEKAAEELGMLGDIYFE